MQRSSSWKYPHQGLILILASFVLATLASIVFLSYTLLTLNRLITQSGDGTRTIQVAQSLLISLDDAETGARGFVITGNEQYLEPYNNAIREIPGILTELRALPPTEVSASRVARLQRLSDERLAILKRIIAIRSEGNESLAREAIADGRGKVVMDALRVEIRDISSTGLAAVRPRQQRAYTHLRRALIVAGVEFVFMLCICGALIWYFQRSLYRERALENTKSEFLSLASHQLRTPATNVKQYIGLLLDGYLGKLTAKQIKALEVAYKNNELEIKIVNDLLDVAKLDLKRIQLSRQEFNVASIVRSVVDDYKKSAEAKGQTLALKAPKRLVACADRTYFRGVVEKLLDNAIKYSSPNTHVTVKLRLTADGKQFEVLVRDHGVGMHKREIPKLFMKFSRLTNEFSANSEGSGTGLYWVKQIVELHGGTIRVATSEGHGSKFTVRLPVG